MIERITIRLPDDLLRRAKHVAAEKGRTLNALIEDSLRRLVIDEATPVRQKRVLPRVSTAKGGLPPGIDITRFSDPQ